METSSTLLNGKALVEGQSIQAGPPQTGQVVGPDAITLTLQVNGRAMTVVADPGATLVQVLRDTLGLTGTKIGCDRGACSACTVWLDGEVASSCMTLVLDAGIGASRRLKALQMARRFIRPARLRRARCDAVWLLHARDGQSCAAGRAQPRLHAGRRQGGSERSPVPVERIRMSAATLAAARAKKSNAKQAETTTSKEGRAMSTDAPALREQQVLYGSLGTASIG